MPNQEPESEPHRDDIADREVFETRFPPEAFEDIARALDLSTDRSSLEELRGWLREELYLFCSTRAPDKSTRAKQKRQLDEDAEAAEKLLLSLRSGSLLDRPRVFLDKEFRERMMRVLESLARKPQCRRHQRLDAFQNDLIPGLIWAYERVTGEDAGKPHWLRDKRAYGGQFYHFARAVRHCLLDCLPEVRAALPTSDDALAQQLQDYWPESFDCDRVATLLKLRFSLPCAENL